MTSPKRPVVAAFDFDGTLTESDNVVPFMRRVAGWKKLIGGAALALPRLVPALARRDRDAIKAIMTRVAFGGADRYRIESEAESWANEIVSKRLRPDTAERLRWHLHQGHRVVIVSASYEVYLARVAATLGIAAALGTRLEVDDGGRYTGRLVGANCRAHEKLRRLDAWLADHDLERGGVTLWAYGDSAGDEQLLAAADHPVWAKGPIASVAASS